MLAPRGTIDPKHVHQSPNKSYRGDSILSNRLGSILQQVKQSCQIPEERESREIDGQSTDPGNRTCWEKWFGSMEPGGVRASILTIISSMIGVGFLTLPMIGKYTGYIPMVCMIAFASFLSFFANMQLGIAFRITRRNNYPLMVEEILGRTSALICLIFIFLYVFASSISYFMFGGIFCWAAFRDNNWLANTDENHDNFIRIFIAAMFLVTFLGSLPAKLTALRYGTLVSSVVVLYVVVVCICDYFSIRDYYVT
jgi:amino acid permease